MVLFSKTFERRKVIHNIEITFQLNICFKLSASPQIPFTFELGIGLVTINYSIYSKLK